MKKIEQFKTHKELLDKLQIEKKLVIEDKIFAEDKMKRLGYFNIIGGYKKLFIDPNTGKYEITTKFEDIYALYEFEKFIFIIYISN